MVKHAPIAGHPEFQQPENLYVSTQTYIADVQLPGYNTPQITLIKCEYIATDFHDDEEIGIIVVIVSDENRLEHFGYIKQIAPTLCRA